MLLLPRANIVTGEPVKPPLTIDLAAPEGNVFALVGRQGMCHAGAGGSTRAGNSSAGVVPDRAPLGGVSYDDVRRMVEQYCEVTWLNEPLPRPASLRQPLAAMAATLGPAAGTPYLVTYEYTESGATQRYGFICAAPNVRGAAENFWNQHPGEWFKLISISDGSIEAFWAPREGRFVGVPGRGGVGL